VRDRTRQRTNAEHPFYFSGKLIKVASEPIYVIGPSKINVLRSPP
jgi:hypothetical protein